MTIQFRTSLPRGVGVRYKPNHHFVELEDRNGNVAHLPAQGLMSHGCRSCNFGWYTTTNQSRICPACGSPDIAKVWGKTQIAFIPEKESDFKHSVVPPAPEGEPSGGSGG